MKSYSGLSSTHTANGAHFWRGVLACFLIGNSSAFIIKWPWPLVYPGTTTQLGTAVGAATINYGFLRPAIILQVPPTTTAATTTTVATTTTTPRNQLFINALLGSALPVNNSVLLSQLASALSNRPVIGGIAQPYPVVGGVSTGAVAGISGIPQIPPQVIGGIASPIGAVGGIATAGGTGGIILPSGFPASGGVASAGFIPGLYPGILGKSAGKGRLLVDTQAKPSAGRVVFASRKRK